jgi:UDP-GlcNAc:undecaprenyl-phosphate GlcNAc-1-phosphate transferase
MSAGLLAFLIALSASLVLTVPVRALAIRVGMVDLPGPRKVHLKPIPLLGGLAMYGGVMLAILIAFDGAARAQSFGIVTGATLVAIVGFLDDRGWLHHQVKLFAGMPLAAVILLASGIHAQVFSVLLGGRPGQWLDGALTILWVVGITASFSILDHMDGLCAGVAAMASVFFAIIAYLNGQARHHACGGGAGGGRRIPALEFQARQDFHGRWRRDVSGISDGHARAETPAGTCQYRRQLAGSGAHPVRHDF